MTYKAGPWIEWNGGERPIGFSALIDVRLRCDARHHGTRGGSMLWHWDHTGADNDIMAYRYSYDEDAPRGMVISKLTSPTPADDGE